MICLFKWIDCERVVAVSFSVAQNGSGLHFLSRCRAVTVVACERDF